MKNCREPSVDIKIRPDRSIKGCAKSASGKEIATVLLKNRKFSKIVKEKNYREETVKVTHIAWGNDFYHQDTKFIKSLEERKIGKEYCEKELQKKQQLKLMLRNIIQKDMTEIMEDRLEKTQNRGG